MQGHTQLRYRADIDGLRAIAVISVVVFHAFPAWLKGGFVGVDIFFVISGFLISSLIFTELAQGNFSFAQFYSRRIRRIFPALITVLLACLAFGWFGLLGEEYKELGEEAAAGAAFIPNLVFLHDANYFHATRTDLFPLLHLWSLGVEEQFYIVWPLLLVFASRRSWNLLAVTLIIATASFLLNVALIKDFPTATFYLPMTRFWELLAGALMAYLAVRRNTQIIAAHSNQQPSINSKPRLENAMSLVGALLIAGCCIGLSSASAFPGWWAAAPTLGAVLIIAAGPNTWFNRKILANRAAVFVGLISYPLYLWHWPLISLTRYIELSEPSRWVRLTAVAASFALAWITYRFIENPIRHKTRPWARQNKKVVVALCSTLAFIAVSGITIYVTNGLNLRFPAEVQHLTYYPYKYDGEYQNGAAFRYKSCFLGQAQQPSEFATSCTDDGFSTAPKSILLWGDSHAAALYQGLKFHQMEYGFKLSQVTYAGCQPVLSGIESGISGSYCAEKTAYVLKRVKELHPNVVLLTAHWWDDDVVAVIETIKALKALNVKEVVVIGPVPIWRWGLPATLYRAYTVNHLIPTRMSYGLNDHVVVVDKALRDSVTKAGARYISSVDTLCNSEGCLTRVGDRPEDLTAFDYGHLTIEGSKFVTGALLATIMAPDGSHPPDNSQSLAPH